MRKARGETLEVCSGLCLPPPSLHPESLTLGCPQYIPLLQVEKLGPETWPGQLLLKAVEPVCARARL